MISVKKLIKVVLFPFYSIVSPKIGFSVFFRKKGEWMLYTRGIVVPVPNVSLTSLEYFRHFAPKEGDLVFDIGGELGLEAKQFSKIVGPRGKVYTFECLPGHVLALEKLAGDRPNLQVVNKACWNKKDTLTFYEGKTAGSGSAVPETKGQRGQDLVDTEQIALEVEADTLDSLWEQYADGSQVSFLKMDIEGAEYEALEGAGKMLERTDAVVIAAYHIRDDIRTADKVAEMLQSASFDVRIDENYHVYGVRKKK